MCGPGTMPYDEVVFGQQVQPPGLLPQWFWCFQKKSQRRMVSADYNRASEEEVPKFL
jgi:hypothetical protein